MEKAKTKKITGQEKTFNELKEGDYIFKITADNLVFKSITLIQDWKEELRFFCNNWSFCVPIDCDYKNSTDDFLFTSSYSLAIQTQIELREERIKELKEEIESKKKQIRELESVDKEVAPEPTSKPIDNKVCYRGDGTIETGERIINILESYGAINAGYEGATKGYYYILGSNMIHMSSSIPEGYVLKEI